MLAAFVALVAGQRERCKFVYQCGKATTNEIYEFSATRIEAHGSVHVLVSHEDITDIRRPTSRRRSSRSRSRKSRRTSGSGSPASCTTPPAST